MKKLLWGLLILLLILGAVGFYMFNMSGDSVAKKDADHSLTAAALYAEYAFFSWACLPFSQSSAP